MIGLFSAIICSFLLKKNKDFNEKEHGYSPGTSVLDPNLITFLCSRQRHRNIVPMLGICIDSKLPYIMSEFIQGFTVKNYIQNKGELVSWPLRVKIVSKKFIL